MLERKDARTSEKL